MNESPLSSQEVPQEHPQQDPNPAHEEELTAATVMPDERTRAVPESPMPVGGGGSSDAEPVLFNPAHPAVGMRLGPYRLERQLGAGGMGTVWLATHVRLEKPVALKLLSPQLTESPEVIARFGREMKAVGRLDDPHLVRAYDAGDEQGTYFLAMEFIDGVDLARLVRQNGPLLVTQAVDFIRQAALGLAAAHRLGLIHRDIKPGNLMLTQAGVLKVTDLGLARLQAEAAAQEIGDTLTTQGQILGTPDYMAPEQWDDTHTVDGRCDLYALGCTLFFLLVGKSPYAATGQTTLTAKMKAHITAPIPKLVSHAPDVPVAVANVYQRLMAKDPADRYPSAEELATVLDRLLKALQNEDPLDGSTFLSNKAARHAAAKRTDDQSSAADGDTFHLGTLPAIKVGGARRKTKRPQPKWHGDPRILTTAGALVLLLLLALWLGRPANEVLGPSVASSKPEITGNAVEDSHVHEESPSGWSDWPADAPKPAIAPFNAEQARRHQEEWANYLGVPVERDFPLGNEESLRMVLVPPGEFLMGSTAAEQARVKELAGEFEDPRDEERVRSEMPQHRVRITHPYYFSKYEVTVGQFAEFVKVTEYKTDPERDGQGAWGMIDGVWKTDPRLIWNSTFPNRLDVNTRPVVSISWYDAQQFCLWMTGRNANFSFELPTEAQWEHACRSGSDGLWCLGDDASELHRFGWFGGRSGKGAGQLHPVGELKANAFGLKDMHGNAAEWCADFYAVDAYAASAIENPSGPEFGIWRTARGGNSVCSDWACRSARRILMSPHPGDWYLGFRPAARIAIAESRVPTGTLIPSGVTNDTAPTPVAKSRVVTSAGWHGWPAEAPKPAIAPFNAEQAKRHQEEWAEYLDVPLEHTNSVGMKLRLIPPGEFPMGSGEEEIAIELQLVKLMSISGSTRIDVVQNRIENSEHPQHQVSITKPFLVGETEVTVGQFKTFVAATGYQTLSEKQQPQVDGSSKPIAFSYLVSPSGIPSTDELPAGAICWNDAVAYCNWLSTQEGLEPSYVQAGSSWMAQLNNSGYRLPTEAEWEFSCRAGRTLRYRPEELHACSWNSLNSGGIHHAVATKSPNNFGLYDMLGNIYEWCQDYWDERWYTRSPGVDPTGPALGQDHVIRGGHYSYNPLTSRAAFRNAFTSTNAAHHNGFRVVVGAEAIQSLSK